jgi:ubiquinone biosynthesis protein
VIASSGADIVLQMALINGRFHGDPHPGNLLCLPGNRIGMIDFGLIGHVSPRRREEFIAFVQALVTDDPVLLAETLARWAELGHQVPRFMPIAEGLVIRHGRRLVLADLVADLFGTLREEKLAFPPDLLLLFKALITLDGVLGAIEPDFDLAAAMRRASGRLVMERLSPERWSRRAAAVALEVDRLGDDLPRLIRALARRAEAPPAPAPAQPFDSRILAAALIVAALIIAAAIMLT